MGKFMWTGLRMEVEGKNFSRKNSVVRLKNEGNRIYFFAHDGIKSTLVHLTRKEVENLANWLKTTAEKMD